MKLYLGIDIGGTSFKSGVINDNYEIVYQHSIPTNHNQTNREALNNLSFIIDDAISKYQIETLGIGIPCVVHNDKIILAPNLPNWNNIDFGEHIRTNFNIPFAMDNDANAAAVAELIAGNGKELNNFVYITLGTGVGGAIIINKEVYRGNIGGAGEIGHIIFNSTNMNKEVNKPAYRNGALETYIGREAIINNYKKQCNENNIPVPADIDVSDISILAENNDKIAVKTLKEAGFKLGIAIATINHILDIGNFIIGGGISQSKLLLTSSEITAREHSLPSVSKIKIQQAKFIQNTGIIGAALLGKIGSKKM